MPFNGTAIFFHSDSQKLVILNQNLDIKVPLEILNEMILGFFILTKDSNIINVVHTNDK